MPSPTVPTELKKLKGTARPCRLNKLEPKPERGLPQPPDHLSERARGVFHIVSKMVFDMGYLTLPDGFALEGLCQAYCDWREAVEFLDRMGSTVYVVERCSPDGVTHEEFKPYPQVTQRNDADKRLRAWLSSCGMTPADRSKVSVVEQKEESPWAEFVQ